MTVPGSAGSLLSARERLLITHVTLARHVDLALLERLGFGARSTIADTVAGLMGCPRPFLWKAPFERVGDPRRVAIGATPAGYRVATAELGRELPEPRRDTSARFLTKVLDLADVYADLALAERPDPAAPAPLPRRMEWTPHGLRLRFRSGSLGEMSVVAPDLHVRPAARNLRVFVELVWFDMKVAAKPLDELRRRVGRYTYWMAASIPWKVAQAGGALPMTVPALLVLVVPEPILAKMDLSRLTNDFAQAAVGVRITTPPRVSRLLASLLDPQTRLAPNDAP